MRESPKQSKPLNKEPLGQVLKVQQNWDGLSSVKVDNGIPRTITILTRTESLADLLGTDLADIRAHLMTRRPGHFRVKRTGDG